MTRIHGSEEFSESCFLHLFQHHEFFAHFLTTELQILHAQACVGFESRESLGNGAVDRLTTTRLGISCRLLIGLGLRFGVRRLFLGLDG